MGVLATALCAAAIGFLIGFYCGYQECFENEILPAHEESYEEQKER